ncbi:MAG: hypothetical protein Q9227_005638 [Pyrenula ochraceoflavens]
MSDIQRIGQAKTGTGKTLAFLLPIAQRILRKDPSLEAPSPRYRSRARTDDIRAIIISPTRELAEQIAVEARKVCAGTGIIVQTSVGGTQKQLHMSKMQREGCHILVGTPGRTCDILSDPRTGVALPNLDAFVMDEADRLLDMNFTAEIDEIKSFMPPLEERDRQTMMFSATIPQNVVGLVRSSLKPDFKFVRTVSSNDVPVHERIPQKVVFLEGLQNQMPAVFEIAQRATQAHKDDPSKNPPFKAIVYLPSTAEVTLANETFECLRDETRAGGRWAPHPLEPAGIFEIHSRLTQIQRTRSSDDFRRTDSGILFSSDVTSRGMDFPNVSHVIQVGLPQQTEDYIHRVGRTGRAGKMGEGWLLVPRATKRDFERMIGRHFPLSEDTTLSTAKVDMTRDAQLPTQTTRILSMIQSAVRSVSISSKSGAYIAMINSLRVHDKQLLIDMINDLSKYGWGLEQPPRLSPSLISRMGLSRVSGLNIGIDRGDRSERSDGSRYGGGRGYGANSRGDESPFGRDAIEPEGNRGGFSGRSSSGGRGGYSGGQGGYGGRQRDSGGRQRDSGRRW